LRLQDVGLLGARSKWSRIPTQLILSMVETCAQSDCWCVLAVRDVSMIDGYRQGRYKHSDDDRGSDAPAYAKCARTMDHSTQRFLRCDSLFAPDGEQVSDSIALLTKSTFLDVGSSWYYTQAGEERRDRKFTCAVEQLPR
jgi:hypothetical protein